MKDAMRFDVPVKKGDIVVVGSDGLMDNMVSPKSPQVSRSQSNLQSPTA